MYNAWWKKMHAKEKHGDKKVSPTAILAAFTLKGNQPLGWKRTLQTFFYVYKPKYNFYILNNVSTFAL